jgi:hypothetical protein
VLHFVYNSPSYTCTCRIICMLENIAKISQNSDKNRQKEQVDVPGGLGDHMPRWLAPPWHRPVCQVALPHHRSVGATPQAFSSIHLVSVCAKGQDGVALDPRAHCHTYGGLQPTSKLTFYPNFNMCCLYNHLWEPTSTVACKGGAS